MGRCEYCSRPTSRNKDNVSFHRFPTDSVLSEVWIQNMGRTDWTPRKESVLCSTHFTDDCFDRMARMRLRKGSIPTIFHPLSKLISINETSMRSTSLYSDPLYIDDVFLAAVRADSQSHRNDSRESSEKIARMLHQPRVTNLLINASPLANPETVQHDHRYADTLPLLVRAKLDSTGTSGNKPVEDRGDGFPECDYRMVVL